MLTLLSLIIASATQVLALSSALPYEEDTGMMTATTTALDTVSTQPSTIVSRPKFSATVDLIQIFPEQNGIFGETAVSNAPSPLSTGIFDQPLPDPAGDLREAPNDWTSIEDGRQVTTSLDSTLTSTLPSTFTVTSTRPFAQPDLTVTTDDYVPFNTTLSPPHSSGTCLYDSSLPSPALDEPQWTGTATGDSFSNFNPKETARPYSIPRSLHGFIKALILPGDISADVPQTASPTAQGHYYIILMADDLRSLPP
ncbi:MAG: hypothetical protein Q9213_007516 [Squamulea squamosa]